MNHAIIRYLLFVLSSTSLLFAQTIINVAPGSGTLASAINAAAPGDILQLIGGSEYTHSSSDITKPLTIQVAPGSTQKAIIKLAETASPSSSYYFFVVKDGAALTLMGLEIHGLLHGVAVAKEMLYFDGRPNPSASKIGTFRFKNCVFHDFADNIVHGMKDDYDRGLIQDSVFIDDVIVYNAQAFLQYKHVKLRHLEIKNSTIYRLQGLGLKIGKIGYRCILANGGAKPYTSLYDDSTITPTGFIDHCTLNDMGDIHGHIQIDDAFQLFTISNCIISNQQRMTGHPLLVAPGTLQPAIYLQDARPDTAAFIKNTCFWKCAPPIIYDGNILSGYAFHDTITMDPTYQDTAHANFTLPVNSLLRTYGSDGGPIGDPRWATNTTPVRQEQKPFPAQFHLSQNYPNPFNPSTTFTYEVVKEGFVSIKIYTVLGEEVASLVNAVRPAGTYITQWNAAGLGSGLYFCKMQSGLFLSTKKMILMK